MARRTSSIGMKPSFSPSMGSENRLKASLISASSSAVMLFSLASLDCRFLGAGLDAPALAPDGALRLAGCRSVSVLIDCSKPKNNQEDLTMVASCDDVLVVLE